jgi:hypothetical protein
MGAITEMNTSDFISISFFVKAQPDGNSHLWPISHELFAKNAHLPHVNTAFLLTIRATLAQS